MTLPEKTRLESLLEWGYMHNFIVPRLMRGSFKARTANSPILVDWNKGIKLLSVGNSHIDAAWLWRKEDTRTKKINVTFDRALLHMSLYPEFTYTQSQAVYYAWTKESYPEIWTDIKQRFEEGRWEVLGGDWVECDANMPSGESLIRQRAAEPGSGSRTIMRIGKAGERLVRYASVTTETYRHFGRMGLGAVFGSKNLKAVAISGKGHYPVTNLKEYRKLYDELYQAATKSPLMKKYHDVGTSINVNVLNGIGALPTRNVASGKFEKAKTISGEHLAENYLGRRLACTGCPVACIHIANLREPYEDEPYFYKTTPVSYDHELIFAAGSMLGIGNTEHFLKLCDAIDKVGLDVISAGVTMAWATEAFKKGMITEQQTAGIKPEWGDHLAYMLMAKNIVDQPNEFYQDIAKGVYFASRKYGGKEFAMTFGKNEMAGYHTGPAGYIGFSIGTRHSHLDNAGYSVDQKTLMEKQVPPETVVDQLVKEEKSRQIISSLTACFFARAMYTPEIISRALKLSGLDVTTADLDRIGGEIYRNKFAFKFREGFTIDPSELPKRIYETPSPVTYLSEEYVKKALDRFAQLIKE
nr:aldehyde ferredoxin oxidoreductase C-terminal domain-containing protein [Candidatus Sigynarchaeum springense]